MLFTLILYDLFMIYWSGSSNYKTTAGLFFNQKIVFPGAGDVSLSLSDVQLPVKQLQRK